MVRWPHVAAFLGLTFGLTWLLDLAIHLRGGLAATPGVVTILQFQMLLPAFSAIILGLFVFSESPLYYRHPAGPARWFYYYYLLMTVVTGLGVLAMWLSPETNALRLLSTSAPVVLSIVGLLVLVILRLRLGREAMERVWLGWGDWPDWVGFGIAFVAFYALQAVLNAVTGLGQSQLPQLPAPAGMSPQIALVLGGIQTVLLGPFIGLLLGFGEEYGWRGYLQNELFQWGRIRGVILVGVIWGAWHWPLILMGFNYPGYPLLGLVLMVLYTTGLAVVLGYAVLRSGSILLAAYLHALNDQVAAFIVAIGFRPHDPAFSFFIGVYGLATLAIVALLVLRDPRWRQPGGNPIHPT
ncbi:MAG TPA: CPBP family intramembrane glutamic endopeptidase [Chloroflexota bacterium]